MQEPFNHRLHSLTTSRHSGKGKRRSQEGKAKQRKKRLALAFSQPCAGFHSSIVSAGWEVMKPNVVAFHTILPQYAPFCLSILISSGTLQSSRRPLLVRLLQGNWPCLHFGPPEGFRFSYCVISVCSSYMAMGFVMAFPRKPTVDFEHFHAILFFVSFSYHTVSLLRIFYVWKTVYRRVKLGP